jgi:outer membrane protein assembly factor BamB
MRVVPGTHIVHRIASYRGGARARRRRAGAAAAALALPLAAVAFTAAPASAAVRYMVTHTIPISGGTYGIAVDSATHTLYVGTAHNDGTLSVIDEATNQITRTTDIGSPVTGLAVDPAAGTAYVTSRSHLFVYNLATGTLIAQLPVPGSTAAVDPARDTAYIAGSDDVYVIQPCR